MGTAPWHTRGMPKRNRAGQGDTIDALLDPSGRNHLPLANSFVQHRDTQDRGIPGPLSSFVSAHFERGLQQYLLLHAAASGGDFDVARDSRVWARALGLQWEADSARNGVSRTWAWLEDRKLIARSRAGRLSKITLLYDDGSGNAYEHPNDQGERYLRLSYAYWRDGWHRKLGLAELAVLLIALSFPKDEFRLVQERVPEWYGVSTSTFQKGVQELVRMDLLKRWHEVKPAPLAPEGFTRINVFETQPPFDRGSLDS